MLSKIKAMILADLWAHNMSTVDLDDRLGKEKGFIKSFLSDEKQQTLPDEMLRRIADALNADPYFYLELIDPTEHDIAHVYLQHKCERIHELTETGKISWTPIDGSISLKTLDKENHIVEVVENEDAEGRIFSFDNPFEWYLDAGPAFSADVGEWKFYLTSAITIDESGDPIGLRTVNAYITDENNHVTDYLEGNGLLVDITQSYTLKSLEYLYDVLRTFYKIPLSSVDYPV